MIGRIFPVAAAALACALATSFPEARAQGFDASDQEQADYVDGNLLFLTYHEVGHMILDQVAEVDQRSDRLASEETADDIATWLMLPDPDEPEQAAEIWAAMNGWLRSAELQEGVGSSPHYPDDAERAARIACYIYGSNPSAFPQIARAFRTSIASVDCEEEVEALREDLETWFEDALIPPASPDGAAVTVRYLSAPAALQAARIYLEESGVLEHASEDISQFVRLPNPVSVVAQSCGRGAAEFRYSPAARRITACYEAVDWLMRDAADEDQDDAPSGPEAANGDEMGSGGARVVRRPRPRPR